MRTRNALVAMLVCTGSLAAQTPPVPQYRLQEEWRIPSKTREGMEIGSISIAPDGRVITAGRPNTRGSLTALDSTGKVTLWEIALSSRQNSDLYSANRIGWTGPTLWVYDRRFDQVALIDAKGKITKSLEIPTFLRPALADRRKFPVFSSSEVLALYTDGARLVLPSEPHELVDTPDYDSTVTQLLRVNAGGTIDRAIALFPADPWVQVGSGRQQMSYFPSLANRTLWNVSPDGMRIVMVRAGMSGKDSATIGLVTLNERGDTVFAKRLPFTPERVTAKSRDSALARVEDSRGAKAEVAKRYAPFYMPVTGVVVGRDRTTWLTLRSAAADTATRTRLVLDVRGDPIGTVATATNISFLAVDRDHVWAVEREGTKIMAVVRYKLVPKR